MSISVVAEPLNAPPRNRVTVSVPSGEIMSSVALYRTVGGVRTLVRQQPAPGLDVRLVDDYECPYGVAATYDWVAEHTDPSSYPTVFNETWASIAAWTLSGIGSWTVSAGRAESSYTTPPVYAGSIRLTRTIGSAAKRRVTINGFTGSSQVSVSIAAYLEIGPDPIDNSKLSVGGNTTAISATALITIDILEDGALVSGSGGEYFLAGDFTVDSIQLIHRRSGSSNTVSVGAIHVYDYPAVTAIAETATPVTLDVDQMWLIHPASPALSLPVSLTDGDNTALTGIGAIENDSTTTTHYILGQSKPVPTNTGPRLGDAFVMTLTTSTRTDMLNINALLRDQLPILILTPPAWDIDFHDDFHDVGDIRAERRIQAPSDPARIVTLPLTAVDSPVVIQGDTGWSYAALAAEVPSYTETVAMFATYADLAANVRI